MSNLETLQVDAAFAAFPRHPSDSKGIDLLEVFAYPNSRLTEAVLAQGGHLGGV